MKQNIEFERCIDFLVRMLDKYGEELLRELEEEKKNNGAGGMGGKIQPSAVLVIQNGQTKLVNVKNQDTVTKIIDMVPDIMDKIKGWKNDRKDPDVEQAVKDTVDSMTK